MERVHDDANEPFDLVGRCVVGVFVNDEEKVHHVAARPKLLLGHLSNETKPIE